MVCQVLSSQINFTDIQILDNSLLCYKQDKYAASNSIKIRKLVSSFENIVIDYTMY